MYCSQCGEENRNDRKFCSNCGAQLRDYTKPRENLIMPEELVAEQLAEKQLNNRLKIFNISLIITMLLAITFIALTFLIVGIWQIVLIALSLSFIIIFICLWIAKSVYKKHKQKQIK